MKPSTFVEWREIYHRERNWLGHLIMFKFDGRRIRMDRELWKCIERNRRIDARMEVEREVKDMTWCMELLRIIREDQP